MSLCVHVTMRMHRACHALRLTASLGTAGIDCQSRGALNYLLHVLNALVTVLPHSASHTHLLLIEFN